jgi:hypothetical protein
VIRGRCPRNFSALFCEWSRLSAVPPLSPDLRALRPRWPRPDADAGFGTGKRCDHLCRSQRRCSRNVGKACSPGFAASFCILSSQIGAVAAALVPSQEEVENMSITPHPLRVHALSQPRLPNRAFESVERTQGGPHPQPGDRWSTPIDAYYWARLPVMTGPPLSISAGTTPTRRHRRGAFHGAEILTLEPPH